MIIGNVCIVNYDTNNHVIMYFFNVLFKNIYCFAFPFHYSVAKIQLTYFFILSLTCNEQYYIVLRILFISWLIGVYIKVFKVHLLNSFSYNYTQTNFLRFLCK